MAGVGSSRLSMGALALAGILFGTVSCKQKNVPNGDGAAFNQVGGSGAAVGKSPIRAEHVTLLFPVPTKELDKSQSTAQVVSALKPHLASLGSVLNEKTYASLLKSVVKSTSENNPVASGVDTEILKIPLDRWFIVAMRFEVCGSSLKVPPKWFSSLPTEIGAALCEQSIRLVAQPFGLRRENAPQGKTRNAWASDDKTFHLGFQYLGGLDASERAAFMSVRQEFEKKLAQDIGSSSFSRQQFVALATRHFSAKDIQASVAKVKAHMAMTVRTLRVNGKGGELTIPMSAPQGIQNYKNYVSTGALFDNAQLRSISHMFSTTGLMPSSDNAWVFGVNIPSIPATPKQFADFTRLPLSFSFTNPAADAVLGLIAQGEHEGFSNRMGDSSAIDAELLGEGNKSSERRAYLLKQTSLRAFVREDANALVGDWENTSENPAGAALKQEMQSVFEKVNSTSLHSFGTQPCMSCHVVPGLRETHDLKNEKPAQIQGNRIVDSALITEQNTLTPPWNLRQLGYFGRSPSIGSRVVLETQHQVAEFAKLP